MTSIRFQFMYSMHWKYWGKGKIISKTFRRSRSSEKHLRDQDHYWKISDIKIIKKSPQRLVSGLAALSEQSLQLALTHTQINYWWLSHHSPSFVSFHQQALVMASDAIVLVFILILCCFHHWSCVGFKD